MKANGVNYAAVKVDIIQGSVVSQKLSFLHLGHNAVHSISLRTNKSMKIGGSFYDEYSLLVQILPYSRIVWKDPVSQMDLHIKHEKKQLRRHQSRKIRANLTKLSLATAVEEFVVGFP